jgi:lycopene beta-cyclase
MDAVFLDVLKHAPAQAPDLFITLAQALRGDELARFMSGIAGPAIIGKIIYAMPKWLFLRSAFRVCLDALIVRLKGAVS